jgi:DNA-binding transcriptional regulator YdaS (Cro superfamily)
MRTLERAAATLGGVEALASRLAVPVPELQRWIAGIPPPPATNVYIAALNIVAR